MRVLVGALALAVGVSACGTGPTDSVPPTTVPIAAVEESAWPEPVPALDVEIVGALQDDDADLVTWAIRRFDAMGLLLPHRVDVDVDPTGRACNGTAGICHVDRFPPGITICAPSGPTAHRVLARRIAVLHELAHLWHRACGDGSSWPDDGDIVGGSVGAQVPWEDRMEERVAVAISWGLLDQLRRPVRSQFACATLFEQFSELTGHPPLEPVEQVCRP